MSEFTKIQYCDTAVNPIMGCHGCELFPSPGEVLGAIDAAAAIAGGTMESRAIFKELVDEVFLNSENPHPGHKQAVNLTNIHHLKERFLTRVKEKHTPEVVLAADTAIRKAVTCYAAVLHLRKGASILDREGIREGMDKPRKPHKGHAPIFETVTQYPGRAVKAAKLPDLLGRFNPITPWMDRLPRLIFVSDMGDALSSRADFGFLQKDLMPAINSDAGRRHLWLWLTKRPGHMVKFAEEIGGFPSNVCAMTTLTGPDGESLKRLADLKLVNAAVRGLSIEPLWGPIPPHKLDLKSIDWVIVGGESGSGDLTRPFALEWAEELRDHCQQQGVAFFLKQLGQKPTRNGQPIKLKDKHGGDWDKWEESLCVREFPKAFHKYRKDEMVPSDEPRPVKKSKEPKAESEIPVTAQKIADFKRLDRIVRKNVAAFEDAGEALLQIHNGKLWRAGGFKTWEEYCRQVAGMSRVHANRTLRASECWRELKTEPIGTVSPVAESQIRPLLRLADTPQRVEAWKSAVKKANGGSPTAVEVTEAVFEILNPEGVSEKPETRSTQRVTIVNRLTEAIRGEMSYDQLEELLKELEKLL
jgi:protein gp37